MEEVLADQVRGYRWSAGIMFLGACGVSALFIKSGCTLLAMTDKDPMRNYIIFEPVITGMVTTLLWWNWTHTILAGRQARMLSEIVRRLKELEGNREN
jgi:hypothetical protein